MTITPQSFRSLREMFQKHTGNLLTESQCELVELKLNPLSYRHGFRSTQALINEVVSTSMSILKNEVIETLLVNETKFFRDQHVFDTLKEFVIPELIKQNRHTQSLSFWSAACSSGQEALSLAMLVLSEFPELVYWDVHIYASDCSTSMVDRLRSGKFNHHDISRGLPVQLRDRFFTEKGEMYVVNSSLQKLVKPFVFNLQSEMVSLPMFDVVLMRNVLIYFDQKLREGVIKNLHPHMSCGSRLFLGGGETLINLDVPFSAEKIGRSMSYCPVQTR